MAALNFKGKAFVQNYHLTVKYHELVPKKAKSLTDKVRLDDNLISHGDNLKALKALLPTYAGKVKCTYIDTHHFIGESREYEVYLFCKPDIEYLKQTALTQNRAKALGAWKGKRPLVFAPTKYLDQEHLLELRIDFAQLPFEIYKFAE